ncbi:diaminopimelate decarboxylase [Candidatus Kaiserbacteria bacterium]|nr:diaminopimelate decarboxylase [Candidatus Kaiserbacteria bacterium]
MNKKPLLNSAEARRLAKEHGTPLYVYRKNIIQKAFRLLHGSIPFPRTKVFYACKANAHAGILKVLKQEGACIEAVSIGEVRAALSAGFPASRISYTCSNISLEELLAVMKTGVRVHLDSLNQIAWWGEAKPNSKISIRVNRGFGAGENPHIVTGGKESKFGIYYTDLPEAIRIASRYRLKIVGLQQHIGSNIFDPHTYLKGVRLMLSTATRFPELEFVDFGGGFGIPYRPEQKPLDVRRLGNETAAIFSEFCRNRGKTLELAIEPGRYLVAEAGALLAQVVDIKKTPGHTFVGINTGFNHLIRPAFYGSYHHVFNLSNPKGRNELVNIVGNICESSDFFVKRRALPKARLRDLLLFADAGAYGYAMSSDYNLREKPKEILI